MKVKYLRKLVLLGSTVLWLCILAVPAGAGVSIGVGIQLPPIVFSAPPVLIVLPETDYDVYVVPDIDVDIFFVDGWWWRPYEGRWYRSHYYDRGWGYYSDEPTFYREVPRDWRQDYRNHQWRGQPWQYQRIHHQEVQKNWNGWKRDKRWEKQQWGVQGLKPQPQHQGQPPQHQGQQPQAQPPQHQGQQPQAQPPQHQGQQPQVQPPQHQGQQPQAKKRQSQKRKKNQEDQGQGDQGQGNKQK